MEQVEMGQLLQLGTALGKATGWMGQKVLHRPGQPGAEALARVVYFLHSMHEASHDAAGLEPSSPPKTMETTDDPQRPALV